MDNSTAPPPPPPISSCEPGQVDLGDLCYEIVSSSQLKNSLWLSAIGGVICLMVFALVRGNRTWKPIYHKRATQISDLLCRPAPLRLTLRGGLQRLWSYLTPALTFSDAELLATAGLDTLILIRFIQMGIQMFTFTTIVGCAVLIPVYQTGDGLQDHVSSNGTVNAESFMLNTLANVSYGSNRLWAAWCIMLFVTFYCLWCLWAHCRSYAALQAVHTHAAEVVKELVHKSTVTRKSLGKSGNNESIENGEDEIDEFIPVAGLMRLVGTRISRERKYGASALGWWKAAGKILWQSVNPIAMLNADIELAEMCADQIAERLRQLEQAEREQKKSKLRSSVGDGVDVDTHSQKLSKRFESKRGILAALDPWAELQNQNWGPAVAAEVPEIVCPWWLSIEDTPAAVNPVLAGGGVLLGKTSPHLRARVPRVRGSMRMWAHAASFVVLYRAGGSSPTDHWGEFLSVEDRLHRVETKLNEETEELLSMAELAASDTTSGGGGENSEDIGEEAKGVKKLKQRMKIVRSKVLATSDEGRTTAEKTLEKTLRKLYPHSFQELVPVYNHIPADKAMQKWDHTAAALSRVERQIEILKLEKKSSYGENGNGGGSMESKLTKRATAAGGGGDIELGTISSTTTITSIPSINSKATKEAETAAENLENLLKSQQELIAELASNETDLAAARATCLATPLGTAYFALFNSQRDARAAAAGHIGSTPLMNMTSEMAPGPDDVNWQGLWAGWRERVLRTIFYTTFPMIIIILFPIGALTGALTNLNLAVCGSGTSGSTQENWAWFCDGPEILSLVITVAIPVSISTFWDTWVMPMVLFIVCQAQRAHASFSSLDKAVINGFYGKFLFVLCI